MAVEKWVKQYIGIPFVKHGRDSDQGLDCWGLVRIVLQEQFEIYLPDFSYDDQRGFLDLPILIDTQKALIATEQVQDLVPGDIVLMKFHGIVSHTGVYVGDGYCLHIERRKNSIIEKLSAPRIRNRIEGVYRVL